MNRRKQVVRDAQPRESRAAARFDRRTVEILALELKMLAKAHGLGVTRVEVTAVSETAKARR